MTEIKLSPLDVAEMEATDSYIRQCGELRRQLASRDSVLAMLEQEAMRHRIDKAEHAVARDRALALGAFCGAAFVGALWLVCR